MTYSFSPKSRLALESCDERLQRVFNEVIKHRDCTIIEGHRGQEAQDEAFRAGKSQVRWPDGNHNKNPSRAVDVAPYFPGVGIPWDDRRAFDHFAGFVLGVAATMGIVLRWGGDWNQDHRPGHGEHFHDLPHFELTA